MNPSKKPEPTALDLAIASEHDFLSSMDRKNDGPAYVAAIDNLTKLYKLKEYTPTPSRVSKDAVVAAAASVGSVILILLFEGVGRGIITSKALGFSPKAKF